MDLLIGILFPIMVIILIVRCIKWKNPPKKERPPIVTDLHTASERRVATMKASDKVPTTPTEGVVAVKNAPTNMRTPNQLMLAALMNLRVEDSIGNPYSGDDSDD